MKKQAWWEIEAQSNEINVSARPSVDAGNISVTDLSEYINNGGKNPGRLVKIVSIPNGVYKTHVLIPNSHRGEVGEEGEVRVTSGKVAIGDACYFFSDSLGVSPDAWTDYLNKTSYLERMSNGFSVDTGGDGSFNTYVSFRPISTGDQSFQDKLKRI
jgi:hypothetical protein